MFRAYVFDDPYYIRQYCNMNITEDETLFLSEILASGCYMKKKDFEKDSVKIQREGNLTF